MKHNISILKKLNQFKKINRHILILCFCGCIILLVVMLSFFDVMRNENLNKEVKEIVRYTMEDYFSQYGIPVATINTLAQESLTDSEPANVSLLSEEDQQIIINSVIDTLEPKIIQKIISQSSEIRMQELEKLENMLEQSISETLEKKVSETLVLSEQQTQLLTQETAVIVETKLMEVIQDKLSDNTEAVKTLEQKLKENLTRIENTLNSYDIKLKTMEQSISELKRGSGQINGEENITNLSKQIVVLQKGYEYFMNEYIAHTANALTVIDLVNDLSTQPTATDKAVMSAKAGYQIYSELNAFKKKIEEDLTNLGIDINEDIITQINQINRSITSMGKRIDELETSMSDNLEELETASATKESLEQVKSSMESALNSTKIALETQSSADLEAAYNQLEAAINEAGDKASQDLLDAKNVLSNALNGTAQEAEQALNATKAALESDIGNVNLKIQEVDAKISEINSTITSIKTDIGKLKEDTTDNYEELKQASATKTELANAKTSLDQSLLLTNQNIANLDTMTSEKLSETKAALDQAITDMGNQAGQDLIDARNALQTAISNNVTDINALQSTLASAQQAITNNKTTVESQINILNSNISNMNNSITSVKSEVESIKSNQVTYVWDSDENGSVLRIITP
ncbi:MAG: hypothetical protein ACI4E5_03185 [Suilimivivens sp.]